MNPAKEILNNALFIERFAKQNKIHLSSDGSRLVMRSDMASASCPFEGPAFAGVVSKEPLIAFLRAVEQVTVQEDKGILRLRDGRITLQLNTSSDFPILALMESYSYSPLFTFDVRMRRYLSLAADSVVKDEGGALSAIHIFTADGKVIIEASDRFHLVRILTGYDAYADFDILLPSSPSIPLADGGEAQLANNIILFNMGDKKAYTPLVTGFKFPNISEFISKAKDSASIVGDIAISKELNHIMHIITSLSSGREVTALSFLFCPQRGVITLLARSEMGQVDAEIPYTPVAGKDETAVMLNSRYFNKITESCDKSMRVFVNGSHGPVCVETDTAVQWVVMPIARW